MANPSVVSPNLPGFYAISKMKRHLLTSVLATMAVLGSFSVQASERTCPNPEFTPVYQRLAPIGDLLSKGEGDYNSVNRGYAGDTPGGIQGLTGLTFENYTVGQVVELQRTRLYAVGRYQFIPSTLRFAVRHSEVDELDMFTPRVQDKLMAALILYKRPAVGAYLRGDHDLQGWALNEMAREWASVEYRNGRGFYDHVGGNRARITRAELSEVLSNVKENWDTPGGMVS